MRIAERLKEAQNTAASLTTFNEVDMSNLIQFRKQWKDYVEKEYGVRLGFMSPFVKASCAAMKAVPAVNAQIEGDSLVFRDYVDVSVAVATPKGLVTPVLRNAEKMNLVQIEQAIAALGKKVGRANARLGKSCGLEADSFLRFHVTRPGITRSPSRTCKAEPLPSPTAASTARSWEPLSSTPPRPPSSVCTRPRIAQSLLTERSK